MNPDINAQFQKMLGRDATPEEAQYLGKFISEGNLQPGEISTLLQSHPEYMQRQLNSNVQQFGNVLGQNDQAVLDKAAATANSRFASLGRPVTSAQSASVLQAGGQLAQQRQSALAQFYGGGLNNNMQFAANQGQNALANAYGMQNQKLQRQWQIEDYNRQQNDFNNYQNAHSGWKALTPEFVTSMAANGIGQYIGGRAGRSSANGGFFG